MPDFQGVLSEAHTRLLARVFRFLRGAARADRGGLPGRAGARDRPQRRRARGAALAHRRDPHLDLHLAPRGLGAGAPLLAGAHARRRGPPLRRAARAADAGVRGPGRHGDRAPRSVGARDERRRRTARCWCRGCGPASSRASASGRTAQRATDRAGCWRRRTARCAASCSSAWRRSRREPDDARSRSGPGAELTWRGSPVARLVGGRRRARAAASRCWARTCSTRRCKERVRRRLAAWLEAKLRPHARAALRAARPGAGRYRARARVRARRGAGRGARAAASHGRSTRSARTSGASWAGSA